MDPVMLGLAGLAIYGFFRKRERPITPEEFASDYGYAPAHYSGEGDDYILSDEDVAEYYRYLDGFGTAQALPDSERRALETRMLALQAQLLHEHANVSGGQLTLA
jgi:hypothetical protein